MNLAEQIPLALAVQEWNPRYLAYARAHGNGPEAQLERDNEVYPGGCMCGFTLWLGARWREWRRMRGMKGLANGAPTYTEA